MSRNAEIFARPRKLPPTRSTTEEIGDDIRAERDERVIVIDVSVLVDVLIGSAATSERLSAEVLIVAAVKVSPSATLMARMQCLSTFRDGGYLVDLAQTLPVLADCARVIGNLDDADRHVHEVPDIAGPRRLRPAHAAALAVRAWTYADRAAAGNQDHFLQRGRDDAEAAHRIATRHRLAWQELDTLDAHARLDQVEGVNRGWATRASALRARLIPPDLDPDPLATVERLVDEDKARDAKDGTDGAQR